MSPEPTPPTEADWALRTRIYQHFVQTTRGPELADLVSSMGWSEAAVEDSLRRLEDAHQLALFPDQHEVWMAHPFSSVPTPFAVETPDGTFWANCAWDALGIPGLLDVDGWVETVCAESGAPMSFGVRGGELQGDDGIFHTVSLIRDAWDDIGFT